MSPLITHNPIINLYFSVYADALLWYQRGKIDYNTFCMDFGSHPTFSRHAKAQTSLALVIWLNENVQGIELDGWQAYTSRRKAAEDVYHVDARGGGGI